jgi:phage shock protein E
MKILMMFFLIFNLLLISFARQISAEQLHEMIQENKNILLYDVRTYQEYRLGTIPGAKNIPFQWIDRVVDDIEKAMETTKDLSVVLFCRTDNRATEAYNILRKNKIKAIVMQDGFSVWKKKYKDLVSTNNTLDYL